MEPLHDMHCHLDFIENGEDLAEQARNAGTLLFANTVDLESWESAQRRFGGLGNVTVGLGLHPWWVGATGSEARVLEALDEHDPMAVGEIGLDFGPRHKAAADAQLQAFAAILRWLAARSGKLLSIHSVRAAQHAIDLLESTGAARENACVFHWFTGPSDQLKRAVNLGCFFSFGPRALATGKGREYVKAVPANRLLLETDYPPTRGATCSYRELRAELQSVANSIAAIKGEEALERIAQTSTTLLHPKPKPPSPALVSS